MNKPWWTFDLPNQDFPIFYVTVRYTATELRFDVSTPLLPFALIHGIPVLGL